METFWLLGSQRRKPIGDEERSRLMAASDSESTHIFRSENNSRRSAYSPVTYGNSVRRGSLSVPASRSGTAVSRASGKIYINVFCCSNRRNENVPDIIYIV